MGLVRIVGVVTLATLLVCGYLGLMDNVTWMNYQISSVSAQKAKLLEATARNEERIARLDSREHLAAFAAGLRMRESEAFALVALPAPRRVVERPPGLAFLSAVAPWLH